jgi:hypothetical protein
VCYKVINVGDKRVADDRSFSPLIIYHPQWLNHLLLNRPAMKQLSSLLSQLLIIGKFRMYAALQQRTTSLNLRSATDSLGRLHDAIASPT